ncbi:MAG: DoxX family protein [Pirellulales bacterium]|jgi:putative oxidoreductase
MPTPSIRYVAPLGRLLLALIFILSAVGKFNDWQGTAKMLADRGLPAADALLSVAVVLEIAGGVSVLVGLFARVGALFLLAFLIPVTLVMHNFWAYEGAEQMGEMINFMKNVSITGGVLLVMAFGAGPCSIDNLVAPPPRPKPVVPS